MLKNLQRAGIMLICFLLVFGTMLGQKTMAATQQPGDQHSVIPNEPITGAAFGSNVYVAVGYYGKILKSTDGFDWQIAADRLRLDVTYTGVAFGGNQFVAVGDQGTVMTSPDGTVWTQRDSTISSRIDRVAYVQNGINKFFAVTTGGKVITSSDGKTWSSMTIGTSNNLTSIAVSDKAIVIGDSGGYVHTSTDGSTWTKHTKLSGSFFINSVLSLNNRFYANDALGSSYTSLDGITWSGPFRAAGNTSSQIFGGLYDTVNFKYYLFGYDGTSYGGIFKSTDATGTTFQQQPKGSTMTSQNAFYANGVFMQLGNDGIVVSTDGVNWQYPYGGSFGNVIYDGSRYVAVGRNGNDGFIKGSVDGVNWSKVNLNLVPAMTSIIYFNGKYVAVGNWGTVATSSDGTTWTVNPTAISDYKLTSVSYGNGVLIAVDEIGTIYKSTNNGVTWLPPVREDTDNYNALQFVSYTNGKFYAAGDYDTYLESTDNGDSWHTVASTAVPSLAFFNINMMQQADIPVTLTNTLKSITVSNRGTTLTQGTDFTVTGSVVTLKKEFLSQLAEGWQTFTFHSSNGASQTFAIKVTNTSAALGQATTVKLSKDGIATWNPVAGAAGYEVQLYRNDSVWGSAVLTSASTLSADFLSSMRSAGPGKYTFKVKAKGNTVNYKDGQQSAASNIVEIYKAPTEDGSANKAGTAQNVNFSIKVNNAVNGAVVTAQVAGVNVLKTVTNVAADASGKATLPIDITKLAEGSNDIVIAFTVGADNFSEELTVTLTKDTIAPLVPTEDGTADKAGTTQNTNFNIVVNAETDAKVTALVGASNVLQVGTDVKAANGKASLPIDLAKLAENANQIAVVVTDAAGNASGTLTVPVTKDTIAPNKPLEDGSADKANTTQNTNFDIIVTAENGAKVTAKVGSTNVLQSGSEVTAANNKADLPIDVTKLAEGPNSITIEVKDAVGNTSTALTIAVNKDTSPPNVPTEDGTANKAGTTQNANFSIFVNAEAGSAVTAKVGGANVLQSGTSVTAVGGKATLPIDFTKLAEGSNVIEVVATDAIGNASNALTVAVAIDTTAPSTPTEDGTAPKAGTTQNANFSIIVNAESGAAVTAKIGGTSVLQSSVTAANGKAILPIDLSLLTEGVNSIEIVATDGMGNASGTLTVPVTKDITPPAAPVEDGTANKDNTTQNANFDIIVTAENGTTVTAKVGSTNVLQSGSEVTAANNKADLPIDVTKLAEGTNSIVIEAKDAVGNTSVTLTITVNKDTKSPDDPAEDGTANKAGTTQNANFNIIVNAETGSTVTAKVGATNVLQSGTSVTAVGDKATLPIDFTKLAEGSNVIEVVATDATGNASNELSVEVTIDTTPPTDPTEDGTAPQAGTTQNANFSIIVNAETGAAVTAKVGGTNVLESGMSVTAVSGKATLPINLSLLTEGLNNIEIVVTDGMGAASGILTVPVTKDTSPPAVPVEDGSADKNNTAQTDNFNIIVDTEAGANVTAMVGNTTVLQAGTNVTAVGGKAILPINLSKLAMGDNDIKIVATDAIGNSSTALTVKVTRELSSNADLSALGVSRGSLNEIFAAGTTNYTLSVANNVESMTVTPTTADAGASVTVKGQTVQSGQASADIALNVGVNHIEIVVTAVNHTTKTYTIDVTRISNNALLANLSVDQGKLTPDFSNAQLHYQVEVLNTVSNLNMFIEKAEPSETITVTGATYSSVTGDVYTYSASNLNVGSNTISIVVTAQDGTTNNTYSLTVERAPILSENADLSNLTLSNGALTPAFASGQTSYTSNVANAVSSLTVTGTLADSHSTMTVNGTPVLSSQTSGNIPLTVGANTITIVVTAQNGTQKTYTTTVNRAAQEITDEHENEHDDAGNSGSVNSDPNSVTATNGQLTLQVGQSGVVSLGDSITISIPVGAALKELKLSIEKLVNTQNLITGKEILVSPIFEILKNFTENFSKPVTLSLSFNPSAVQKDQRPSVFYYDEVQKQWVEVAGGIVNGDRITVAVNHFTKYAVFAVGPTEPTKEPSGNPAFRDIAGHWAEASIKNAVSGGIVSGYPDSTFKPDSTVTRAEFAVMLMNALKLQGEGAQLTFTDNAKIGAWAQQAIGKAVKAGIIHGYEDGSFRPDAQITRAEMAVIIANAMGASTTASAATGFSDDETIPTWAKGSVAFVKQAGIVQGRDKNTFAPQANATRAESVVVLLKALEKKNK